jgi:DNA-binding Xre family transcriptional regulator
MTRRPARRGRPARRLVINWALIEQRRIAAGMTHAQLAARAGPGAVTGPPRLWTDNDHDAVPLGLLERLCQVLDLHPAELFQPPARAAQRRRALPPAGPPGDETVLEAALATVTTPSGQPGTPIPRPPWLTRWAGPWTGWTRRWPPSPATWPEPGSASTPTQPPPARPCGGYGPATGT